MDNEKMKQFEFRKKIAKEAYKRYIGNRKNITPENVAKANAFCMGARFAVQPDCNKN
jgi:hypothetical protein